MNPELLSNIYKLLSTQKIADFPKNEADFSAQMKDPAIAKSVYDHLSTQNVKDLPGSFDDFHAQLFPDLKKKDSTEPAQVSSPPSVPGGKQWLSQSELQPTLGSDLPKLSPETIGNAKIAGDELRLRRLATGEVQDNSETNPLVTATRMAVKTGVFDLPAEAISAYQASESFRTKGMSDLEKYGPDQGTRTGRTSITPEGKIKYETVDKAGEPSQNIDEKMMNWATEWSKNGQGLTEGLVTRLSDVKDPIDLLNWVGGVVGQSGVQVPLAILSGGSSSFGQEIGSIYMDAVQKLAQEKGISPGQVIAMGLDSPASALAYGAAAGTLDYLGAKKVINGVGREEFTKSLQGRAMDLLNVSKYEGGTEYAQTWLEQLGTDKTTGKSFAKAWRNANTSDKALERLESLAAGAVAGPAIGSVASLQGPENKVNAPDGDLGKEAGQPVQPKPGPVNGQDVAGQQAQPIKEEIKQVKQNVEQPQLPPHEATTETPGPGTPSQVERKPDIAGGTEQNPAPAQPEEPNGGRGNQEADKGLINNTAATQGFFSDVVTGKSDKFKPVRPYEPLLKFDEKQSEFNKVYSKFKGNFDEHIATSIPAFRDVQVKKGQAIVDMLPKGGTMIDIAGSEGGLNKAITQVSNGKIKTINLDVNPDMKVAHEASPVPGADYVQNSFLQDYEENGVTYKKYVPEAKADVVHETMGFQFMSPQRAEQFAEVAKNYLKPDGVFITEQKVGNENWDQNEIQKDEHFKSRFYTPEQIAEKNKVVKVSDFDSNEGMVGNMVKESVVTDELAKNFKYVQQYWDGGNFKGYIASNDKAKIDRFMSSIGSTQSEFSNRSELFSNTPEPKSVQDQLQSGSWSILTAENPNAKEGTTEENKLANESLLNDLKSMGYNPVPAEGRYAGNVENSFFVPGLSKEDALTLGKKYGQESVMTNEGLAFSSGDLMKADLGKIKFNPKTGDYTKIGDTKFNIPLIQNEEQKTEATEPGHLIEPITTPDVKTDEAKNGDESSRVGQKVNFIWNGSERTGTIVGSTDSGRIKVSARNGARSTTYIVKPEDVITPQPAPYSGDTIESVSKSLDDVVNKFTKRTKKTKDDNSGIVASSINPFAPLHAAFRALNKAQELTFGKMARVFEDWVSEKENLGIVHRRKSVRVAANMAKNLIGGLPYSTGAIIDKVNFIGNKNYGHLKAKLMSEEMYKIVDSDLTSLSRVHEVLDPEVYKPKTPPAGPIKDRIEDQKEKFGYQQLPKHTLTYADLSPSEQALFDAIRSVNDFIHEWSHNNGFISDDTYKEHKGQYIARLYEDFFLDAPEDITQAYKSSRMDFSMYKQRKMNVQLQIVQDPVFATAYRLSQIMQSQAIIDYSHQVKKFEEFKISDTEYPGSVQLGQPGSKPYYGFLTGKWVPPHIAEDFKGYFFMNKAMNDLYAGFRGYDKNVVRQFLKKSHTVYNPLVQLGNATANISFAFWTGVDPIQYIATMPQAYREMKSHGQYLMDAVKRGLIGTDVLSQDIAPIQKNKGVLGSQPTDIIGMAKDVYGQFDQATSSLYSSSDDVAKLSSFISLQNNGYSAEKAAQMVYEGFQNYATVGKAYDFASKTPVFGNPYIKFKADLARIMKNAISRRPLTAGIYLAMLMGIKNWLSEDSGEDPNIQAIRESRSFIPKIPTPFGDVPMTWQTRYGEVNFARFMTPYYVYDKGPGGSMIDDITNWLPYQLQERPSWASKDLTIPWPEFADVFLGTYAQMAIDSDFRGKSIRDPRGNEYRTVANTWQEQGLNALNYVSMSQIPFFKTYNDMVAAFRGEADYYGRERTITQAILNNIIKVQEFGPPQAQRYIEGEIKYKVAKIEDCNRSIGQLRSVYAEDVRKIDGGSRTDAQKNEAKAKALEQFYIRFNKQLVTQAELVKDLENTTKLLEKLK